MADTGLRKRGNKNESGSQPAVVADGSNDSSKQQRGSKKDRDCNKPFGKVICFTLGLFVLVPLLFAAVVFRSAYNNFQLGYGGQSLLFFISPSSFVSFCFDPSRFVVVLTVYHPCE